MNIATVSGRERPARILLVEDNFGDVLLTKKAFTAARLANEIAVASDGEQALAMLRRAAPYADQPTPDIILLDLNLPGKSGQEVLEEIKSDPALRSIPVIILTSSYAELDVVKSYGLHANSYIVKPIDPQQFSEIARTIAQFWFTMVVLPDAPVTAAAASGTVGGAA